MSKVNYPAHAHASTLLTSCFYWHNNKHLRWVKKNKARCLTTQRYQLILVVITLSSFHYSQVNLQWLTWKNAIVYILVEQFEWAPQKSANINESVSRMLLSTNSNQCLKFEENCYSSIRGTFHFGRSIEVFLSHEIRRRSIRFNLLCFFFFFQFTKGFEFCEEFI